jgi:putative transposase
MDVSRPLRIEWPGGLYHVTSRGNRREAIVEDDEDRLAWVDLLGQCCERFNWRVHAWCLMTNHYHLLLETPEANLSLGMRHLNGVWSQAFNRRHQRVGHVFQGRFKAVIVERESYLLELARYVVLNPVRACMVSDAAHYPWSSYRATAGMSGHAVPGWLETDWLLRQFGTHRRQAIARYVDHVRAGVGLPSVWESLQGQVFLGGEAFVARMQASLGDDSALRDVPKRQRRPLKRPLAEFAAAGGSRDEAMALAFESGQYRQREIAQFFEVHETTVSRAVRRSRKVAAGGSSSVPQFVRERVS